MPGAVLLLLDNDSRGRFTCLHRRLDSLAAVAHDAGGDCRLQRPHRAQHMLNQWQTQDWVHDLGGGGLHAGSSAGGQHYDSVNAHEPQA